MKVQLLELVGAIFLLTITMTYLIRKYAIKFRVLDIPNERSSHSFPTPRGGGLAIVFSWFIGISVLYSLNALEAKLYYALMCGILLAIVSLIDDLFTISPLVRLTVQLITAILAFIFIQGLRPIDILGTSFDSKILLFSLCIICIVWFINLFNFLDGIDGYASIEAISLSIIMYYYSGNVVCLILIAATMGFLFWNWPKAKIFMGDIGSTQLGFILVLLGIYFHNTSSLSIIHWTILSSLFWFDATLTLVRRILNKEKITIAHKKHAYQRAFQSGFSHLQIILMATAINSIIICFVIFTMHWKSLLIPIFLIDILFLYLITRVIDKKVPFK